MTSYAFPAGTVRTMYVQCTYSARWVNVLSAPGPLIDLNFHIKDCSNHGNRKNNSFTTFNKMYVCMYVYIYMCVCVCVCACACACVRSCMYVCMYVCMFVSFIDSEGYSQTN